MGKTTTIIFSNHRVLRLHTLLTVLLLAAIFLGAGGGIFTAQAAGSSTANFVQDENFSGEAGLSGATLQQYLDSQAGPFKNYQENSLGGSQKAAQVLLIASQQDGFSVNPLLILSLYQIHYNVLTSATLTPQNVASFWPEYVKSPSHLNDQIAALSYRVQSYYDDNTAKPGQLTIKLKDGTTVQATPGLNRTSVAILRVLGETATQSEWTKLLGVTSSVFKTSYTAARAKVGANAVPKSYPGRFLQHPRKDHNTGINAQLDHDQSGGDFRL